MRLHASLVAMTMAAMIGGGCNSSYVVGQNSGGRNGGGMAGRPAGVAGGSGIAGASGTGGGLGGAPLPAGTGGAAGTPGTTGSGGVSPGAGGGGAIGAAGSGAFVNPPPLDVPPTPESAGPLALQHLTKAELRNTIADLLGASPAAVDAALADMPADEASMTTGYLDASTYSQLQTQKIQSVAEALAAPPAGALSADCIAPAAGAAATTCATGFVGSFGRRAFRRPLTAAESDALLGVFNAAIGLGFDFPGAIKEVVVAALQSPNFLYHWEVGDAVAPRVGNLITLTPYQVASRLSYLLWQTMPDDALLAAADNAQLATPAQILAQANRMLGDARAQAGVVNFSRQWLALTNIESLYEDPTVYPSFTAAEPLAFGAELNRFVSSVLLPSGDGTLKTLLTAPYTYEDDAAAAAIYGGTATAAPGSPLPLDPTERAGVLTQLAFLATYSQPLLTDPLARGLAVWRQLLCAEPASATHVAFDANAIDVTAPRRAQYAQIYAQQSAPGTCAACHASFDPLGFAFENYDMIGGYRTVDNGHPIDPSGTTVTPAGTTISFKNAVELVNALAVNDEVKWCVTRQWFRFVLGRMESTADLGSMQLAYRAGAAVPGFSVREMLTSLVQTQAFRFRAPSSGEL